MSDGRIESGVGRPARACLEKHRTCPQVGRRNPVVPGRRQNAILCQTKGTPSSLATSMYACDLLIQCPSYIRSPSWKMVGAAGSVASRHNLTALLCHAMYPSMSSRNDAISQLGK